MNKINVAVVDDDSEFRRVLAHELGKIGFDTTPLESGAALLQHLESRPCDVILMDVRMPGLSGMDLVPRVKASYPSAQTILLTGFGTIDSAVRALKDGAFDYLTKPADLNRIETTIRNAFRVTRLEQQNVMLKQKLAYHSVFPEMLGTSPVMQEMKRFIDQVARTNASVLILGESGVGKEVMAKAIHNASDRRNQGFMVIDCGTLQESMLASELFGHEKGAYTGAVGLKHGLFEIADGGTLLLDEIGDIPLSIQVKLLRILETSRFRRLGGIRDLNINVRIVASTNRDLHKLVSDGLFRQDLFYRLNVVVVTLPPLRDRREDIPQLIEHFLALKHDANGQTKTIAPPALQALRAYDWPGNVRELRNIIERLVILSSGDSIGVDDLPAEIRSPGENMSNAPLKDIQDLRRGESDHIHRTLNSAGGNRRQAAAMLGINPKTLYRKLKK